MPIVPPIGVEKARTGKKGLKNRFMPIMDTDY
jgi:hypothetical protein